MSRQYHLKQEKVREPYGKFIRNLHENNPFMLPVITDSEILSNSEFNYQLYMHIILVSQRRQGEQFRHINIYRLLNYLCGSKLIPRGAVAKERINTLIENSKDVMYMSGDELIIDHTKVLYVKIPSDEGKQLMWEHSSAIKILLTLYLNIVKFGNIIMDRDYLGRSVGADSVTTISRYISRCEDMGYIHITRVYDNETQKTTNMYCWKSDTWD